ncbi:hypothetical protein FQN53_006240, partial [Emmonsiellopsis sp. PD_33]
MPILSRLVSVILRIGQIGFAAVVAGIIGHYLRTFDKADAWPEGRWIYTVVIAGLSMLLGLIWLIPFSSSFTTWPIDLLLSFAWFAAFGVLVNALNKMHCGAIFNWGGLTRNTVCSRWKAAEAFSFLSAILWLASTIVGIWFVSRKRDHAVAGDGPGHR